MFKIYICKNPVYSLSDLLVYFMLIFFIINSSHGYVVTSIKGRFSAPVLLRDPATVVNTIDGVKSIVAA